MINSNAKSNLATTDNKKPVKFYDALNAVLKQRNRRLKNLCDVSNPVAKRILEDYGAVFFANESVFTPPVCIFPDAKSVTKFQSQIEIAQTDFDGTVIELQTAALKALLLAQEEALSLGFDITPRGGSEAARRSFDDTLRLWHSRLVPALAHWTKLEQIDFDEAEQLKNLPLLKQIAAVLRLEEQNIFFSKDFSKSILYSVAAPGSSQHLSLLAFDANEFQIAQVRSVLARYGWFRTVHNDLPHFTFLGRNETDLPALGLKKLETTNGEFWIPNV